MLRASERLIGVTEVAFVELSGGLAKLRPLIFQSDYEVLADLDRKVNEGYQSTV
jgi:hypothetical protein